MPGAEEAQPDGRGGLARVRRGGFEVDGHRRANSPVQRAGHQDRDATVGVGEGDQFRQLGGRGRYPADEQCQAPVFVIWPGKATIPDPRWTEQPVRGSEPTGKRLLAQPEQAQSVVEGVTVLGTVEMLEFGKRPGHDEVVPARPLIRRELDGSGGDELVGGHGLAADHGDAHDLKVQQQVAARGGAHREQPRHHVTYPARHRMPCPGPDAREVELPAHLLPPGRERERRRRLTSGAGQQDLQRRRVWHEVHAHVVRHGAAACAQRRREFLQRRPQAHGRRRSRVVAIVRLRRAQGPLDALCRIIDGQRYPPTRPSPVALASSQRLQAGQHPAREQGRGGCLGNDPLLVQAGRARRDRGPVAPFGQSLRCLRLSPLTGESRCVARAGVRSPEPRIRRLVAGVLAAPRLLRMPAGRRGRRLRARRRLGGAGRRDRQLPPWIDERRIGEHDTVVHHVTDIQVRDLRIAIARAQVMLGKGPQTIARLDRDELNLRFAGGERRGSGSRDRGHRVVTRNGGGQRHGAGGPGRRKADGRRRAER